MASKRKKEEDENDLIPSKVGKYGSDKVKRSDRVRKKPARFIDKDGNVADVVDDESTAQSLPQSDGSGVIKVEMAMDEELTSRPHPVIPPMFHIPVQANAHPDQILESTSHDDVSGLLSLAQQVPTAIIPTTIKTEPEMQLSQSAEITEASNVKSTRVRKKSAKVLEMEEFEEAERTKTSKKSGKVTSPDPLSLVTDEEQKVMSGGLPHVLQAANIQMNLMSALKASPMQTAADQPSPVLHTSPGQQESLLDVSGKKSSSKKKKSPAVTSVSDGDLKTKITLKIPKSKVKPMDTGSLALSSESLLSDQYIKEEITETIDPNLLLSPSSEPLGNLTGISMKVKTEPVSPVKIAAKKGKSKKQVVDQLHYEADQGAPQNIGKLSPSSSVIKMLLNKPAQFSEPVVSTQALTHLKSPNSESKVTKKSTKSKKEFQTEVSSDLKKKTSTAPIKLKLSLDSESGEVQLPMLSESFSDETSMPVIGSEKKKVKKMKKKSSTPVRDEEDDYIDDEDEEDDDIDEDDDDDEDDDIDMIDDHIDDSLGWEFETQDGNLIIAEDTTKKSKKTSTKKKAKMKSSSKGSVHVDDTQTSYATKGKKMRTPREKKKKRLTAYTMWCNSVRAKVLNESPGMDFAQLSRRLGEIWQSVPSKDKTNWKRKAKREARRLMGKGLLITTGKKGSGNTSNNSTYTAAPVDTYTTSSTSSTPPPIQHPPIRHHAPKSHTAHITPTVVAPKMDESAIIGSPVKGLGIEPIDTAAHLKLVGDSLSIIGMRLQEHRGLIAVQGSLSVLLDSLLCAVGPLMCLTTQVPELNGLPAETHTKILDNVAYVMPGL